MTREGQVRANDETEGGGGRGRSLWEPLGAGTGRGADFPPELLKDRGPADTSILALKTHLGLLTRRTGRSVCVPRVTKRGVIHDSTPPLRPTPHTCVPACGVFLPLTPAGPALAVLQVHLFQEAFRAHLAESPPRFNVDPPYLGTESFRAMVSNHVKKSLEGTPKKSWCLGGILSFFKPRYSLWAARAANGGDGAYRFVPSPCAYAVSGVPLPRAQPRARHLVGVS